MKATADSEIDATPSCGSAQVTCGTIGAENLNGKIIHSPHGGSDVADFSFEGIADAYKT
jgi:hypothetical protein